MFSWVRFQPGWNRAPLLTEETFVAETKGEDKTTPSGNAHLGEMKD